MKFNIKKHMAEDEVMEGEKEKVGASDRIALMIAAAEILLPIIFVIFGVMVAVSFLIIKLSGN